MHLKELCRRKRRAGDAQFVDEAGEAACAAWIGIAVTADVCRVVPVIVVDGAALSFLAGIAILKLVLLVIDVKFVGRAVPGERDMVPRPVVDLPGSGLAFVPAVQDGAVKARRKRSVFLHVKGPFFARPLRRTHAPGDWRENIVRAGRAHAIVRRAHKTFHCQRIRAFRVEIAGGFDLERSAVIGATGSAAISLMTCCEAHGGGIGATGFRDGVVDAPADEGLRVGGRVGRGLIVGGAGYFCGRVDIDVRRGVERRCLVGRDGRNSSLLAGIGRTGQHKKILY